MKSDPFRDPIQESVMNKMIVVAICTVVLTAGRVWAQEVNAAANGAVAVNMTAPVLSDNFDNMENEALNDEGYGTDDEEYYGSENDMANTQDDADEALPTDVDEPMPTNADEPAADNAVGQ